VGSAEITGNMVISHAASGVIDFNGPQTTTVVGVVLLLGIVPTPNGPGSHARPCPLTSFTTVLSRCVLMRVSRTALGQGGVVVALWSGGCWGQSGGWFQVVNRVVISCRYWAAVSRCRQGRKCGDIPLNADRNRCA
jgi:hypothetical protein